MCIRDVARGDYCDRHVKAYENIVKIHAVWKKALELSWKEYLSEIAKNPVTGSWARDVAEHLAKTGEEPDV